MTLAPRSPHHKPLISWWALPIPREDWPARVAQETEAMRYSSEGKRLAFNCAGQMWIPEAITSRQRQAS